MRDIFLILLVFLSATQVRANVVAITGEELIPIQLVSETRKSFVINKGKIDGIRLGQEMLFSNRNISIKAQAIEVSRHLSQWKAVEDDATIPFNRYELVIMNPKLDTIYDVIPHFTEDFVGYRFKPWHNWTVRGSYSRTVSESVSDASGDQKTVREGTHFEGLYSWRNHPNFDFGVGLRIDREEMKVPEVGIIAPHKRDMVLLESLYHFEDIKGTKDHWYIGLAAALGKSSTDVDGQVSTGYSFVLPAGKLGYYKTVNPKLAFLFEGIVESVTIREEFASTDEILGDTGTQEYSLTNFKLSFGIRF
jgi:hypothetical protein